MGFHVPSACFIRANPLDEPRFFQTAQIPLGGPECITSPIGNVILLSQTRYQSLLDSIYLLSQPCLVSRIKEGENEATDDMETFHFHDSY